MNEDDVLQKVLANRNPAEILHKKVRRVKITLTVIAFLNILGFLLFFPYEVMTGYTIAEIDIPPAPRLIILAVTFITVSLLIWIQLRKLAVLAIAAS